MTTDFFFILFQFKKKGIVYNCLSQRTMHKYDADSILKNSKPIQMTLNAGEDPRDRKSSFINIFNDQTWGGRESGVYDKMSENYKASGPGSDIHRTIVRILFLAHLSTTCSRGAFRITWCLSLSSVIKNFFKHLPSP